ncbi:MAG TPA: replication-relaxation family protein [Thermomicrobiales bacterium]|nr:replication-relaxation family protein [Thermomicrobiales bacterium]
MPTPPRRPSTAKRPRSRYVQTGKPKRPYPLAHIARGLDALVALDRLGLPTNGQVRDLLFADAPSPTTGRPRSAAYARKLANLTCRRLWDSGLVRRQSAILTSYRTGGPYLHFSNILTPAGARAVAEHYAETGAGTPRWSRSLYDLGPHQVDHSLTINDVSIRAHRAAARAGLALRDWRDDRQLMARQRDGRAHFVILPDGFFVLEAGGVPYGHFLELDRGTEAQTSRRQPDRAWARKIEGYGRYLTRLIAGDPPFAASALPLVLTVTLSPRRLAGLLETTRQAGGGGRYWFTTAQDLLAGDDPDSSWAPIWRVPTDAVSRSLRERLMRS